MDLRRGRSAGTAKRPRRGELPRVAPRHALSHFNGLSSSRTKWSVAAAVLAAGLGGVIVSSGVSPRPAAAQSERTTGTSTAQTVMATPTILDSSSPTAAAPTSTRQRPTPAQAASDVSALAADGIPATALKAYEQAAARTRVSDAACGLTWPLLAAIGRVESDHGRFVGAVLHTDGVSTPRIIGIALDGHGTALVLDTDHGRLDGDQVYDHAVGPMQFIPSTWALYGVDANGDGIADPFNIFDAAQTAAKYLCAAGGDLTTLAGQVQAVLTYNDSDAYLSLVLGLEKTYARGIAGLIVPVLPATGAPRSTPHLHVPPADPGAALGAMPGPTTSPTGRSGSSGATSPTGTASVTGTASATGSGSPTGTASATGSGSPTGPGSPTGTVSPTGTATPTGPGNSPGTTSPATSTAATTNPSPSPAGSPT